MLSICPESAADSATTANRLSPVPHSAVPRHINRSIQLTGGHLEISNLKLAGQFSVALWFWLGHESGASNRSGSLIGDIILRQNDQHRVKVAIGDKASAEIGYADDWHFVVLVQDQGELRIYIDGNLKPVLSLNSSGGPETLDLGRKLEGRLDEITIWDRVIEPSLIAKLWNISKVGEENAKRAVSRAERKKRVQVQSSDLAEGS
jgi:hypothetical protein